MGYVSLSCIFSIMIKLIHTQGGSLGLPQFFFCVPFLPVLFVLTYGVYACVVCFCGFDIGTFFEMFWVLSCVYMIWGLSSSVPSHAHPA
jgi:hypothetical protein